MKKKKGSIALNFLYNMAYQISLVILPLITSPYLSRVVGSEGLGNYAYSHSVAYYFFLFGMLGVNNYGNRNIAAIREDKEKLDYTFSRIYYFQLIISGVSSATYLFYCVCICRANPTLAFAQIFYVLSAVLNINWFFFGIEEFRITVIRKIAIKLITSILIFVFIKSPEHVLCYTLLLAGAEFLGEIYLWYYLPKYVKFHKVPLRAIFKGTKEIAILFIPIVATSIYRYMDKIMIGTLGTMNGVGQYDYAEKIIMICLGFMNALGTVMLPKMANLIAKHEDDKVQKYLVNSMQFAMMTSFALAFGLFCVGYRLAILYFGKSYAECGRALSLLSVTVIPIAWANVVRTQYLIPSAKDKEYLISVCVGAVLNFIINYMLIPSFGLTGAIAGTITAEYSVAILQTIQVRKEIRIKEFVKKSIPFLMIGVVMFIGAYTVGVYTSDNLIGLVLQVIVGGLIYVGLAAWYCIKEKNEIYDYVSAFIRRKIKKHKH